MKIMGKTKNKQSANNCCSQIIMVVVVCILLGMFIFSYYVQYYRNSGEHISAPDYYPEDATDYCFFENSILKFCEFNLPKDSFLKYSREENWEITDIEKTDIFFMLDYNTGKKKEYTGKKPLTIVRYISRLKPEHHECFSRECQIDTTGLTENACVRSISKGYFYMTYNDAARGITVLYDSEKECCYLEYRFR